MKRTYGQNCALAHTLDLIGERWTLLLVRELMVGPKRYGELIDNLVGIGTNLLAARLKEMERHGLIEKSGRRYQLTALGRRLKPAVWELVRFGLELGIPDEHQRVSRAEWDVVALRALYREDSGESLEGLYVIELDGQPFRIEKLGSEIRVACGDHEAPRVRVALSKTSARDLMEEKVTLDQATRSGSVRIAGRQREAKQLLAAFGLKP